MKINGKDKFELSVSETEIWESVAENSDGIELADETKSILAERLSRHETNPKEGTLWKELKSRLSPK